MICLFIISVLSTPAIAQEKNKYTDTKRIEILQSVAYFSIGDDSIGIKYSEELENKYLQMSDNEFKEAIKSNLKDVVAKINKGSKIIWNKDFVDKTIKSDFPEIYNDIVQQVKQQKEILSNVSPLAYTPGDTEKTFSHYGKNVFGMNLFGLFCKVRWYWDSTKITNVLPSTWGEVYAPLWEYKGLVNSEQSKWNDSGTIYRVYKKGHFVSSLNGNIIQNAYLWLEIFVLAGGDSILNVGG